MAKALIIKGADFSAVAVDHIVTEPKEYIELAYIGSSWSDESRVEGAIALLIQYSNNKGFVTISSGAVSDYTFEDNSIVKYKGMYYKTLSNKYLVPYYGLTSVNVEWSTKGYKLSSGTMSEVNDADFRRCQIEAKAGEVYYFILFGAGGITEVIKEANGEYTSVFDIVTTAGEYKKVTIEDDCTLYVSYYPESGKYTTPLVAKQK